MTQGAVEAALLVQNEQCVPPLEESEIRGIAASVSRYPSEVQPPDSDHDGDVEREVHRLHVRDAAQRQVRAEQRGTSAPPQGHVLAEWQRSDDAPLTYRIEGWQPADSRVLLVAQFKAGKTTVVGNLIRSLVDGDPFLGTAAVVPVEGTVALIDTEMSERQLKYWLRDQQIAHPDRVVVYPLRGRVETLDIRDEDVRREWVERLRAARVAYLVIDCFRPILDALGLDENHDAGRVLVAIDALLQDAGIRDCLVVHHMGHTGERSRGDSRLRDWPDVEWRLVRQADDPASPRFLSAFGRDVDVPESAITYDELSRRLTLAGGSRADAAAEAALGAVLEVLTAPLSGRGIEKALADSDHKRPAIRRAITLGQKRGVLRARPRSGRGGGTEYAKCAGDPNCATSAPAQKRRCASAPIEGALLNTDQGEEVSRVTYIGFDPAERWAVT